MKWILIIASISILCSSCRRDTPMDNIEILWKMKLTENTPHFGDDPILYKNLVIQKVPDEGEIIAFKKETGEEVWRWTVGFDKYGVDGFGLGGYIYENIYITGDVNLTVAINLDSGQTVWEDLVSTNAVAYFTGVGDKIVKYDYNPDVEYFIRLGNAKTGEFETIHHWEREDDFFIGNTLPLIFEWEGVEYVVWSQIKWGSPNGIAESNQFLHLYNLNDRQMQWVSDTIDLESRASGTAGLRPKFYDGQIYLENDAIYSYNIEDGSLEWRNHYHGRFDRSRLTIANGKVFANNNNNSYMIALDAHTGFEYWRTPTGNGVSRIIEHDDKIYIAGGLNNSERKLYILDAKSGEKILEHKLQGNQLITGQFDDIIAVDSTTGLIYTGDHEHLMCIDFNH